MLLLLRTTAIACGGCISARKLKFGTGFVHVPQSLSTLQLGAPVDVVSQVWVPVLQAPHSVLMMQRSAFPVQPPTPPWQLSPLPQSPSLMQVVEGLFMQCPGLGSGWPQ